MEIIKVENLSFTYPDREQKVLDNITLRINSGEFVLICGHSGCGKTTLLRMLKRELSPHGEKSGEIFYKKKNQTELTARESAEEIGFVLQTPEQQIVTDKVWHELAFGLESLGISNSVIRRKTAETASYFGLEKLFRSDTATLSGGEKQLLNLASVMVTDPNVLILDEPTSQLDPIAAREFINTIDRLNKEWELTVIVSEHRTEELFPIADRIIIMENGRIIANDTPDKVGKTLRGNNVSMGFPTVVRLFGELAVSNTVKKCPLTVKDGRNFLAENYKTDIKSLPVNEYTHSDNIAIELTDLCFKYSADDTDILKGLNLKIYCGEVYSLLGGNGAGKTTLAKIISGIETPYAGRVKILGKSIKKYRSNSLYKNTLSSLPQNPREVFIKSSVIDDFKEIKLVMKMSDDEFENEIIGLCKRFGISELLNSHPYDLSGGEQQKAALVKILLLKPRILLLDEPTKGMDAYSKKSLREIIKALKNTGITVFIVTHDVEFAADCSDRCGMLFDGDIVSQDVPSRFFSENAYYTTSASKLTRGLYNNTVTLEEAIEICKLNGVY